MNSLPLFLNKNILLLSVARFLQSMAASIFIPILPIYIKGLDTPLFGSLSETTKAGIVISFFGIAMTLIQSPVGYLSDRSNRRKVFILGAVFIFSLLCFALARVETYWSLLTLRALQGLCVGATLPVLMAMVAVFSPQESRGQAMGIYSTFHQVGFIAGPIVGGILVDLWGFEIAFYLGGVMGLFCLFFVFFLVPETAEREDASRRKREGQSPLPVKEKLPRDHYILAFILFAMMVGITLIVPLFPIYKEKFHASYSDLSWIFSSLVFTRLLTQIPVGYLSDVRSKKFLIFLGLLFFIPVTLLLGFATSIFQMILLRLGQGAAATLIMTPAMALAANLAPVSQRGKAMGIIGMGFTSGISLGPLMAGICVSYGETIPFWVATFLCILSLPIALWILRDKEEVGGEEPEL